MDQKPSCPRSDSSPVLAIAAGALALAIFVVDAITALDIAVAVLLRRSNQLFDWVREGRLKVHVGGRYPLAEAAQAHRDIQSRRTTGKLLLIP
jgi:NADPH:quinone reductase-like Zn-dependent oxidoreductase